MDTNINSFLNWSQDQLAQAGIFSPRLDSEIILGHTLKLSRIDLRIQSKRVLNESEKKLGKINIERRQKREPVSQIVGYQEFWSLDFIVDENVLTPRPETEILIETALNCLPPFASKILDLGTGSGIIAVVMAKEVPGCQFSALEIDPKTLSIAKENGLLYSTLQHDAETCPNFGLGNDALASLTKCDPSGIIVFLSKGIKPTIFCLLRSINASLFNERFRSEEHTSELQ